MSSLRTEIRLAIDGGRPLRAEFLPIARPHIDDDDVAAVVRTLRSGWLATGPQTAEFELGFAKRVGAPHAVGLNSGTAALELALEVAGVGCGDEVITTPFTFAATAHAIVRNGATPVFADIDPDSWNLDPGDVAARVTQRTRAILPVHFAGRSCDMRGLSAVAESCESVLISDAAHAIETVHGGRPLAGWAPLTAYSFHPVKNLTTGEGGMLVTHDDRWAERLRLMRLHGVAGDAWSRRSGNDVDRDDVVLGGHKCNMSDLQAALGLTQLAKLDRHHALRTRLWSLYDAGLAGIEGLQLPAAEPACELHARHIYNVILDEERLVIGRDRFRAALNAENVGTGLHYRALHRTTYYRELLGPAFPELPHATRVAAGTVTLPLHAGMSEDDAYSVVAAVRKVLGSQG